MQEERIVWTFQEYKERLAQMKKMGLSDDEISAVLECVIIRSDKPLFFISEE